MKRALLFFALAACTRTAPPPPPGGPPVLGTLLTGEAAKGDFRTDAPGVRRKLTLADLPPPNDTPSVDNGAHIVKRPEGAMPKVPPDFRVSLFATDLENPRMIRAAPNGDLFVAESEANRVRILKPDGRAVLFADGLK